MSTSDQFIIDVRKTARDNDIRVKFSTKDMVYAKGDPMGCTGYFDEDEMTLCVSNKNNRKRFVSVLLHESSHMDQYLHDKYLWEKCNPGYTIFFQWLEGDTDVRREVLEEAVQDIIRIELDAEKRAIDKIAKYRLGSFIDKALYIRQTNAYLHGYLFALETKTWTPQIYYNEEVIFASSTRLKTSYTKIPGKIHRLFLKHFSSQ
jgi:hypothetical protein